MLLGSHTTLCGSALQGPSCRRSRDHLTSSPLPNRQEEGRGAGAPEESHSDTSILGAPAGTGMTQIRHSPRDGTGRQHGRRVRSWLICTPDALSLVHPPPKCRFFRCKQAELQTESQLFQTDLFTQQTLQDCTQTGALESTTHGPKWTSVPGLWEGVRSETSVVMGFGFYKMKSSRDGVMAPRQGECT